MFFPQLFGIVGEKLVYTKDHQYDDPEDLCDDRYLLEVRTSTSYALVKSGIQPRKFSVSVGWCLVLNFEVQVTSIA